MLIACIVFNLWSITIHLQTGTIDEFFQPFAHRNFLYAVLYLGILSSVLTSFLTHHAISLVPASQIAVFNNLSPIFAVIGGIVFLEDKLYFYHFIGGILIAIGIVMTLRVNNK